MKKLALKNKIYTVKWSVFCGILVSRVVGLVMLINRLLIFCQNINTESLFFSVIEKNLKTRKENYFLNLLLIFVMLIRLGGTEFKAIVEREDQVEISFKRNWDASLQNIVYLNTDIRLMYFPLICSNPFFFFFIKCTYAIIISGMIQIKIYIVWIPCCYKKL